MECGEPIYKSSPFDRVEKSGKVLVGPYTNPNPPSVPLMKNDDLWAFFKSLKFYHAMWLAAWLISLNLTSLFSVSAAEMLNVIWCIMTFALLWAVMMNCDECRRRYWPMGQSAVTHRCPLCDEFRRLAHIGPMIVPPLPEEDVPPRSRMLPYARRVSPVTDVNMLTRVTQRLRETPTQQYPFEAPSFTHKH